MQPNERHCGYSQTNARSLMVYLSAWGNNIECLFPYRTKTIIGQYHWYHYCHHFLNLFLKEGRSRWNRLSMNQKDC